MRRPYALLASLALSGCTCGKSAVNYKGPHAAVPARLEFGSVRVATRVVKAIAVSNDGRGELTVAPSVDPATASAFTAEFDPGTHLTALAGETVQLNVEYLPVAPGEHTGRILLQTNSEGAPAIEVELHGTAVTSALQVCRVDAGGEACDDQLAAGTNLAVDFGQVNPGAQVERQLVLRAKGDAAVRIAKASVTAQSAPGYSVSGLPALPVDLPPGQTLRFTVAFKPTLGGAAPAQLEILSDSSAQPRKLVDLVGQGIAPRLCIDRADRDFGGVNVNTTARKTAHLRSCGLQPLRIDSISTTAPFSLDGTPPALPQTLQPGAVLDLPLAFRPLVPGTVTKPLAIATNEASPGSFALEGEGLQCILDLGPKTTDFGQVSTAVRATKTFLVRSTGYSDCTVIAMRGPSGSPGFSIPSPLTMPLVVPVGMEIPVEVAFQPPAAGSASAQISVDSDDSTAPTLVEQLVAQGIAPPPCDFVAQPASVQFGAVDVGKSVSANVVVTNRGSSECYIKGGGASGDASFSATLPSGFPPPTLGSGASLTVPVKFAPTSAALHVGQLTVKYNPDPVSFGGDKTLTVPLQGGTLLPKMCLSPTLLDFGAVSPGGRAVKSFVISSCGDGTLTVRGIQAAAGTSADFSLVSPPAVPLQLPKGSSATINVAYAPLTSSAAAGRIDVFSNDPALPTGSVELRGNLGPCATQLVCTPSAVSFSGTMVGRTAAQPVTCVAASGAVTVSSVSAGAGTGPDLTFQAGRLPVTLQHGDTLRAEVQFAPSSAGAQVGSFTLSTGTCGDAKVDVEAIGLAPTLPPCPVATTFTPKTKWAWNGGSVMSSWSNVTMTPVVANLGDDDGDGRVDENDVPDVVFASCSTGSCCVDCFDPQHMEKADLSGEAVLRAVSGKDGSALWTADASSLHVPAGAMIAVADLDADGEPEIIAVQHSFRPGQTCPGASVDSLPMCFKYVTGSLLVLDRFGKVKFVSEPWTQPPEIMENDSSLLVADLDQDGFPEIIYGDTVFDSTGHVKWRMSATIGSTGHGTFAAAADVDGDGKLELLAGPTAYRADGTVLWRASHVDDGIDLVLDVDGDGKPEVVVRPFASRLVVLDGLTGTVKRQIDFPVGADQGGVDASACPAGPSAGDFLGNGRMQLAVPAGNWFFLVRPDTGAIVWQKPIEDYDGQCGSSGAAVFSFFGDGKSDVVYHDSRSIWVWRADGTEVYKAPRNSSTLLETPVIADIDNDGHAEILITNQGLGGTNNGLTALSDAAGSWPATRRVWTQWNYHVTDANENATVPRVEQPHWKTSKLWRGNPALCKH